MAADEFRQKAWLIQGCSSNRLSADIHALGLDGLFMPSDAAERIAILDDNRTRVVA